MNVWIAESVSPYQSITGVYRSLGAAVRAAKREVPGAQWDRISHLGLCAGVGYAMSGKRKVHPWAYREYREFEYVFFRFVRRKINTTSTNTNLSKEK